MSGYTPDSLRMMVRMELNESLYNVAGGANFGEQVFTLIEWAESHGRVADLISGACAGNPQNHELMGLLHAVTPATLWDSAAPVPVQLDWVRIPAGPFVMGSDPEVDPLARPEEMPQHLLELPAFAICRTPVTVAQFAAFVHATSYLTGAEAAGWAYGWTGSVFTEIAGANWEHPRGLRSSAAAKQDHPVTCINWHDAAAFCRWACGRLPSEAEWEKAARGGSGRIYPWGDFEPADTLCNFDRRGGDTTPVGTHPAGASAYGLLDMAGNVWEWTRTVWGSDREHPSFLYPYLAADGREHADPETQSLRMVLRGGSPSTARAPTLCAAPPGGGSPRLPRTTMQGFASCVQSVSDKVRSSPRARSSMQRKPCAALIPTPDRTAVGACCSVSPWQALQAPTASAMVGK